MSEPVTDEQLKLWQQIARELRHQAGITPSGHGDTRQCVADFASTPWQWCAYCLTAEASDVLARLAAGAEPPLTAAGLLDDLARLQRRFEAEAFSNSMAASNYKAGSGGWWEMNGYASILSDAMRRIRVHRKRTEGVDRQIARETPSDLTVESIEVDRARMEELRQQAVSKDSAAPKLES